MTIVELLVVVAVLAILAAVAVFAVGGLDRGAERSACLAEARNVRTGLEIFRSRADGYPTAANDTTDDGQQFVPGVLDTVPDRVDVLYGATPHDRPDLEWAGPCDSLTDLPPTP